MAEPYVLLPETRVAFDSVKTLLTAGSGKRIPFGVPLTICGPAGSGKTALLKHLLGDQVSAKQQSTKANSSAIYSTGIEWADDFRRADRDSTTGKWLARQQQAPTLVIDGVDTLSRHKTVSEQLCTVIDSAILNGAKLILSVSSLPGQQRGFSRRLADRIRGGTVVGLEQLSAASAEKLLTHFVSRRQMQADPAAIKRLSSFAGTTPADVLRVVQDMEKRSLRQRSGITPGIVSEYIRQTQGEPPSIPQIAKAVAKEFSARVSDLRAEGRAQSVVVPRQTAMFLAREIAGEQYQTIGDYFGHRNHSTVLHSVRKVEQMLDDSPEFASRVVQIRSALGLQN